MKAGYNTYIHQKWTTPTANEYPYFYRDLSIAHNTKILICIALLDRLRTKE